MSEYAHKGQILPIENQMIPISKDTTFHASFDEGLHGFNQGELIQPIGPTGSVAFPGSSPDRLECRIGQGIDPSVSTIHMEMWARASSLLVGRMVFGGQNGSSQRLYVGVGNAGMWEIGIQSLGWAQGTVAVTTEWVQLKLEVASGVATLYVNGEKSCERNYSSFQIASNWGIGGMFGGGYQWQGNIADVKVSINGEVAFHYPMNERDGNIIFDTSGNSGDLTLVGGLYFDKGSWNVPGQGPGKFGKACVISPARTNVITNTQWDNWSFSYNKDIRYDDIPPPEGIQSKVASFVDGDGDGRGYLYCYADNAPQEASTTYTISVYVKAEKPFALYGYTADNSEVGRRNTNTVWVYPEDDWKRVVFDPIVTGADNESDSLSFNFAVFEPESRVWMCAPQMEANNYASAFVIGSRATEELQYPIRVMDAAEGTLSFWAKLPYALPLIINESETLFGTTGTTYDSGESLCFKATNSVYNDRILGIHWAGEGGGLNHLARVVGDVPGYRTGDWNHYIISWKREEGYSFYINGVNLGSAGSNLPLRKFDGEALKFRGMEMDELRIESRKISEEEAAAWATAGLHYNYLDYSMKAD